MGILDGFEVVPAPAAPGISTTKYAELFDKALEVGADKCLAKEFGSRREAAYKAQGIRERLKVWSRREPRWKGIVVFYRDVTVYVHAKEGES